MVKVPVRKNNACNLGAIGFFDNKIRIAARIDDEDPRKTLCLGAGDDVGIHPQHSGLQAQRFYTVSDDTPPSQSSVCTESDSSVQPFWQVEPL